MAVTKQGPSDLQWRDKYLTLNEKYDKLKLQVGTRNEQLRRGLVLVSLLAEGQSAPLDNTLADLRESMRGSTSDLNKTMNKLNGQIKEYDLSQAEHSAALAEKITQMAEKLCHCQIPKKLVSEVRALRKAAPDALNDWQGYSHQLEGWAGVLATLVTLDETSGDSAKGPWWKKVFSKEKPSPGAVEETESQSGSDDVADNDEPAEPGFSTIAREVASALNGLISRLVVPERLHQRSDELQKRLDDGLHWYEFVSVLEDTSQFLLDCLGSGQEEFERFLHSLDQRLQAIQTMVSDANSGQADREDARTSLETMVRDQIDDIRGVVNGLGDLGELGSSVRDHLTTIVRAMEHYQEVESQREARLAEQLEVLQNRLSEMEAEASQARQIIEDQKKRATLDHLTGLPNRAAYEVQLGEELMKRSRGGRSLSFIICDVDHFKHINDNYGHIAGDKVLQLIASTLRKNLRDTDFIARYGGEEFVILLPGTQTDGAAGVAEKLRASIEACPFNFRGERVSITMSFGISEFRALESTEMVFDRADKALYEAKKSGRNRAVVA
jgi:diguanylate cyclase